jgi:hypothetical protein
MNPTGFSLFRKDKKKESDENPGDLTSSVTEETRKKAAAAKVYIENMYKNQYQNIQERSNR